MSIICLVLITGEGTSRTCFLNLVCLAINPSTSLKSFLSFSEIRKSISEPQIVKFSHEYLLGIDHSFKELHDLNEIEIIAKMKEEALKLVHTFIATR